MNDGPHRRMSSTTTKEHTCGKAAEAQVEVPTHSTLDAHARADVALAVVAVVERPASQILRVAMAAGARFALSNKVAASIHSPLCAVTTRQQAVLRNTPSLQSAASRSAVNLRLVSTVRLLADHGSVQCMAWSASWLYRAEWLTGT